MNKNKQLAINLTAQIVGFIVNFGIGFFLSPFIVKNVGAEANGFVTLGNNFVSYASLLSAALNSMAGRFVTIHYVKDDYKNANSYFSSVFFANIFLSAVFVIPATLIIVFLERIVNVSDNLVADVKLLWAFIFLNYLVTIVGNVFTVATFATNKLYLASIRTIISQLIRALILVVCFSVFPKYIWFIGLASLAQNLYSTITNISYTKKLTPNLKIRKSSFDIKKIKEIISSGIWNSISSLGTTLLDSLDLLIANIFIGKTEMGILSVAKTIPGVIINLIGSMCSIFAPSLTIDFANNDKDSMLQNLKMSMRLTGLFTCVPISVLVIFGDSFYSIWQPTLDSRQLQILSILTISAFLVSGVINVIYNLFTVTNNVKIPAIAHVSMGVINTLIVLLLVNVTDLGVYAVAGVSGVLGIIKNLFIVVPYSCKCLGIKKTTFYPDIARCILATVIACAIGCFIDNFVTITGWLTLIVFGVVYAAIGLACYLAICTNKSDRAFLVNIIKNTIIKKIKR